MVAGRPDSEQHRGANRLDGDATIRYTVGCTAALILTSIVVLFWPSSGSFMQRFRLEWPIWMLVCQLLVVGGVAWKYGLPASRRGRVVFALSNGLLLTVAGLCLFHLMEFVLTRFLELMLRAAVAGSWGLALAGVPLVLRWIRQRRRGCRRPYALAKWWFLSAVVLVTAEPLAVLIDWQRYRLTFPSLDKTPHADELHIVTLGGSTMIGHPYNPRFGIPNVFAWRLQQMYPDQTVVMHNLAKEGINLQQAVARLENLEHRPHHLLLYSGHNEFYHGMEELVRTSSSPFLRIDHWLEWSPSFRLLSQPLAERLAVRTARVETGRAFIDFPVAPPLIHQRRLSRFRRQLQQLANFCRNRGITAQWFVPAAAESVYEPTRSVVSRGTNEAEKDELRQMHQRAKALESQGRWSLAADVYRDGLALQPGFAEFHFLLGECLFRLKQYDQAREHYALARDEDGHPVRANRDYRRAIADVAAENGIRVLDAAEVLRPHTEFGILDRSMFHDNVHPTLRGFFLLGAAAADDWCRSRRLEPRFGQSADVEPARFSQATKGLGVTVDDLVLAYRRAGHDLVHLARYRFDESRRRREGARYEHWAEQLKTGEIKPGDEGTESLD